MRLRFPEKHIKPVAAKYQYQYSDAELNDLKPIIRKRGFLTLTELELIARWKAPRIAGHVGKNERAYVEEITRFSLHGDNERARIEPLTLLSGVSWPMASVILHFFHKDPYPILDYRALWSVGAQVPKQYSFDTWWPYVELCRKLARQNRVDMRTLDRALWQYSKENQKTR